MIIISPGGKRVFNALTIPTTYRCALVYFLTFQIACELAYNPRYVPVIVR